MNEVWLELILLAHDLLVWTQQLALTGELAKAEPKRLRYRLHTAGRLALHARRAGLHLSDTWLWAQDLINAFARLDALPAPGAHLAGPPPRHGISLRPPRPSASEPHPNPGGPGPEAFPLQRR